MKNRQQTNRIGITASKRIGRAVQRNRAKRVIREALMMLKPQLKPGYDLVVVARSRTPYRKTQDVYADLRQAALRAAPGCSTRRRTPARRPRIMPHEKNLDLADTRLSAQHLFPNSARLQIHPHLFAVCDRGA